MSTVKSHWSKLLNTRWIVSSTHFKSVPEPTNMDLVPQKQSRVSEHQSSISQSVRDTLMKIYKYSQTAESETDNVKQIIPATNPKRRPLPLPVVSDSTLTFEESILMTNESVREYYRPTQTSNQVLAVPNLPSAEPVKTVKVDSRAERRIKLWEAKEQQLSQLTVIHRMKALTSNLMIRGISNNSRLTRLREVVDYAVANPAACDPVREIGIVPFFLKLEEHLKSKLDDREGNITNKKLLSTVREGLSVMGYVPPIQSAGIRILTIDGGGTRGLVAIETLKQIEILSQKPLHQMFDYICGVSTGGLLALLVGGLKLTLDQCEAVYKDCSQRIFSRGTLAGAAGLLTKHSFYDMSVWEGILKDEIGESLTMLSTSKDEHSPKIGVISTLMSGVPENFVFRNYNHDVTTTSQYPGTCDARIWEAVRASSAAPGYFEDFKLGDMVHQDGGVLNNNPTAIAIHEARTLWPNEKIQCVVSLGNGRHETDMNSSITSLREKVGAFIHSATNTEVVHTVLSDLLEPNTYFRFNPYLTENFQLNEIKEEKLHKMQFETQLYLRRNANKVKKAGQQLEKKRNKAAVLKDSIQHRYSILGTRI